MKCPTCGEQKKIVRSTDQNSSLHLFFNMISVELNEMGAEFHYDGVKGMSLTTRYTPLIVKEFFWKPIQESLHGFSTTTKLSTKEMNEVADVIIKFFGDKGIVLQFPSEETRNI